MVDLRLWFQKRADARYISHLDLSRCMQRALKRSGLPVWYTEGFHPHAYVTFALPLSLGQESLCEIMDFRLSQERPLEEVLSALSRALPPDLPVVRCAPPVKKTKEIASAAYAVIFPGYAASLERLAEFVRLPSVLVTKKGKKGGEKEVDVAPYLSTAACRVEGDDLVLNIVLPAGSDQTVNPSLIVGALEKAWGEDTGSRIVRLSILDKDGRDFC